MGRVNSVGVKCVDQVALQAVLQSIPAGLRGKCRAARNGEMVYGLLDVKRRGRQGDQSLETENTGHEKEGEGVQGGQGLPSRRNRTRP